MSRRRLKAFSVTDSRRLLFWSPCSGLLIMSGENFDSKKPAPGMAAAVADDDVAGQHRVALAVELQQPGAHGGVTDRAAQGVAGVHVVVALLVGALGRVHRVDDGELVHQLRGAPESIADVEAVHHRKHRAGRAHHLVPGLGSKVSRWLMPPAM